MPRFDEIRNTIIAIGKIIPDPRRTRYVQYRLTLKDGDPTQVFPADGRQTVQPGPDKNSLDPERRHGRPQRRRSRPGGSRRHVHTLQRHGHQRRPAGQEPDDTRGG